MTPTERKKVPLVGRGKILGEIQERLEDVFGGTSRYILLKGEAGIGKSRVVEAFREYCSGRGVTWLFSRCTFDAEGNPYRPIQEALEEHLKGAEPEDDSSPGPVTPMSMLGVGMAQIGMSGVGRVGAERSRNGEGSAGDGYGEARGAARPMNMPMGLLPMAVAGTADAGEPVVAMPSFDDTSAERGRDKLFADVVKVMQRLSRKAPVVMVLENFQWAPDGTLQLVRHLARTATGERLMFIATYRPEEETGEAGGERRPFYEFMEEPEAGELFVELVIPRLGRDEVGELIRALFQGMEPPDHFVRWIHQKTDGNPLFVEEIIDNLTAEGLIDRTDYSWFRELDVSEIHVPRTLREVVVHRIRNLDQTTSKVLQIASALGRTFDFKVLEKVAQLPENELLDSLDKLLAARLVKEEQGTEQELYRFENVVVQEMAYAELSRSRKLRLHNRAGEVIEEMYADRIAQVAFDLARHFTQAQNYERAIPYLLRSGSYATEVYAFHEAARYYRQALECFGKVERTRENLSLKMEVYNRLGHILLLTGEWNESLEVNSKLITLTRELDDVLRRAEAHRRIADIHRQRGKWKDAVENYQAALELSEGVGELYGIFEGHKGLGHVHWRKGEFDDAVDHFNQILRMAEEIQDTYITAIVFIDMGNVYNTQDQFEKAAEYYQKSIVTLKEMDDPYELSRAYNNLGDVYMKMGQWEDALRCFSESHMRALEGGNVFMKAWSRFNAAECHVSLGNYDMARDMCEEAMPELERLDNRIGLSAAYRNLGLVDYAEGKVEEGDRNFSRSFELLGDLDAPAEVGETYLKQAFALHKAGETERARQAYLKAREHYSTIGAPRHLDRIARALDELDAGPGAL